MYHQELGPNTRASHLVQPHGAICARVTGSMSTEDAKMTGITPAMFTFSGR